MPAIAKLNHHFMRHLFELMWHYLTEYRIKLYMTCQMRIHGSFAVGFSLHFCKWLAEKSVSQPFTILVPALCQARYWVQSCIIETVARQTDSVVLAVVVSTKGSLQGRKALISSVCWFLWCKNSHHHLGDRCDATESDLGKRY